MGALRVYRGLKDVWGPKGCIGALRMYGGLKDVWGP